MLAAVHQQDVNISCLVLSNPEVIDAHMGWESPEQVPGPVTSPEPTNRVDLGTYYPHIETGV